MNKSYWAVIALTFSLCVASCSKPKGDSESSNFIVSATPGFEYDVKMEPMDIKAFYMNGQSLNVTYTGNVKEEVSFSLEGLPQGCTVEYGMKTGTPPFQTYIVFNDSNTVPGTYPMKLICEGSHTGKRIYNFNLVAMPEQDNTQWLLGTYTACGGNCFSIHNGYDTVTSVRGNKRNELFLYNIDHANGAISAFISSNGYVTVPQQTVNGAIYEGTGSLATGARVGMQLDLKKTDANGTQTCSYQVE